ncbi:uncharacterized protein LOC129758148 [Uranotaenia lowii]|uniref:uncharacterized protein LOC129758148 n=1 Tax=Uranotaenia lowii TaxID=190385 RepID=UPI00247A5CCE|nr:uncharacterized protein LOC129758148 [Uranotaenia lowii]
MYRMKRSSRQNSTKKTAAKRQKRDKEDEKVESVSPPEQALEESDSVIYIGTISYPPPATETVSLISGLELCSDGIDQIFGNESKFNLSDGEEENSTSSAVVDQQLSFPESPTNNQNVIESGEYHLRSNEILATEATNNEPESA